MLRLACMLCLAIMASIFKHLLDLGVHVVELLFIRAVFAFLILVLWAQIKTKNLSVLIPNHWGGQALRAGLGIIGMSLMTVTIGILPLAEATVLIFCSPIFAAVFAWVFLSERLVWRQVLAILLSFLGIVVVANPSGGGLPVLGLILGILGAGVAGLVVTTLRYVSRSDSALVTTFSITVMGIVVFGLIYPWFAQAHSFYIWFLIFIASVFTTLGQSLNALSLSYSSVVSLGTADFTQIIWAALIGFLIWHEIPAQTTFLGAFIIVVSSIFVIRSKK